jgi:hypothetical protein
MWLAEPWLKHYALKQSMHTPVWVISVGRENVLLSFIPKAKAKSKVD